MADTSPKILMLIGLFHPFIGGAERECQNLSKKFAGRGHSVTVLTSYQEGLPPFEVVEGIPVYRKIRGWHLYEFTYMLSVLLLLWRQRRNFDCIICFGLYLYTVPAVLFALCTGKKIITRLECSGSFGDLHKISVFKSRRLILTCLKWSHRVVAISSAIEEELLHHGCPASKIARITNSVDIDRFSPPMKQEEHAVFRICLIGRLEKQKGIDILLYALKTLSDKGVACAAVIVGDGPERDNLMAEVQRLSLTDSVTFTGPQQDVAPFYKNSDMLVMPSRYEGLPLVLLEAMASGLAIAASSIGGIPEVLSPEEKQVPLGAEYAVCAHGVLVPPENPMQLALAIEHLFRDAALRKRLGCAARSHVENHYCLDAVAQQYLLLFGNP